MASGATYLTGRNLLRRARRGLYAGRMVLSGNMISEDGGNRQDSIPVKMQAPCLDNAGVKHFLILAFTDAVSAGAVCDCLGMSALAGRGASGSPMCRARSYTATSWTGTSPFASPHTRCGEHSLASSGASALWVGAVSCQPAMGTHVSGPPLAVLVQISDLQPASRNMLGMPAASLHMRDCSLQGKSRHDPLVTMYKSECLGALRKCAHQPPMSLEPTCDVATAAIVTFQAATGSMLPIVSCLNCSNKGGSLERIT